MALDAFLKLSGADTGEGVGSVRIKGIEQQIKVIGCDHEILSDRDPATGHPTGKPKHKSFTIIKDVDSSSPQLHKLHASGELFRDWNLSFHRVVPTGGRDLQRAITHVRPMQQLAGYTIVECRLETGRTHQIRIHLSELGHPVCGDRVYCQRRDGTVVEDRSGAPRLFLHAAELGFRHPATGEEMHWEMSLPEDLGAVLRRLRGKPEAPARE